MGRILINLLKHLSVAAIMVCAPRSYVSAQQPGYTLGDKYSIEYVYSAVHHSDTGPLTIGSDMLLEETVLDVSLEGTLLKFDWPKSVTEEDRIHNWFYPIEVLRLNDGSLQLMNQDQIQARLNKSLSLRGLDESACNTSYFTWAPMYIECDIRRPFHLVNEDLYLNAQSPGVGEPFSASGASSAAPLLGTDIDGRVTILSSESRLDSGALRQDWASEKLIVSRFAGTPLKSIEESLELIADLTFTGTMQTKLEVGSSGLITQRIRKKEITVQDGSTILETRSVMQTVKRTKIENSP